MARERAVSRSLRRALSRSLLLACGAALAGCATTVTLVPEPLACPVADDVLAQRCDAPVMLADGATYYALIQAGVDDRAALRACAAHDRLLADALRECSAAIVLYQGRIREINAGLAGKP